MAPRETDLYLPVKRFFEKQGFSVKGEVGAADLVAMRGNEMAVVELKLGFSLALYHQAAERLRFTEAVWIAVYRPEGRRAKRTLTDNGALCRRLGIGLLTVRKRDGHVDVVVPPGAPLPRRSVKKAAGMARAFARLTGDPNEGGATRHGLVTGYRQDAVRCAAYLAEYGAAKGAAVARDTGVPQATRIMADNHYGWFRRVERGVYALTDAGLRGLADWSDSLG